MGRFLLRSSISSSKQLTCVVGATERTRSRRPYTQGASNSYIYAGESGLRNQRIPLGPLYCSHGCRRLVTILRAGKACQGSTASLTWRFALLTVAAASCVHDVRIESKYASRPLLGVYSTHHVPLGGRPLSMAFRLRLPVAQTCAAPAAICERARAGGERALLRQTEQRSIVKRYTTRWRAGGARAPRAEIPLNV